jgi:hypothetical protein
VTRFEACLLTAALALPGVATAADAPSPFVGTWVLDVAKSKFDPPPGLKSETVSVTDAGGGAIHTTIDYVEGDASASKAHFEFTTALDGKEVPVSGGAEADSVVATLVKPRMAKYVFKKGGKWVETVTATVSTSGNKFRAWVHGKDGQVVWNYHGVFERQ